MKKSVSLKIRSTMLSILLIGGYASAEYKQNQGVDLTNVNIKQNLSHQTSDFGLNFSTTKFSAITNFKILDASTVSFDFNTPNDGVLGRVMIWKDATEVDLNTAPYITQKLESHSGHYILRTNKINFQQGIYTIAITAGKYKETVAATKTMIFGRLAQSGGSALAVTDTSLDTITAIFNSPPNVDAGENATWLRIFKGKYEDKQPESTNLMFEMTDPNGSSGLISIDISDTHEQKLFENNEIYTIIFNPGPTKNAVAAAHTFRYILQ